MKKSLRRNALRDTSWIKPHLMEYFSLQRNDFKCVALLDEKIKLFGGKLYKYYDFNDPYALKNIRDNTIHFSKPEQFNDPFDCALGFSLDKAVSAFLPNIIDDKLNIEGVDGNLTKALISQLLLDGQVENTNDKIAQLISFFLSKPQFKDIVVKHINGEFTSEEDFQAALMSLLLEPQVISDFLTSISKPGNEHLFDNIGENQSLQIILDAFAKNPAEIAKLLAPNQETLEIQKGISIITAVSAENRVTDKIAKLAEITGDTDGRLKAELERVRRELEPVMEDTKRKINNLFAITCFSEKSDSVLMWSHYANKHTGFCVEYDLTKCGSLSAKLLLFPVIYTDERATIPMSLIDFSNPEKPIPGRSDIFLSDMVISLLTKSKIWDYEKEWRIIEMQSNLKDGHLLQSDMISKVYLGANSSLENELALRAALQQDVPIEKYEIDAESYKLNLRKGSYEE